MPTQRTGIGNEDPVRIISVDVDSAEIVSQSNVEEPNINRIINYLDVPITVDAGNNITVSTVNNVSNQDNVSVNNSAESTIVINSEQINNTSVAPTVILTKSLPNSNTDLRTLSTNSLNEVVTTTHTLKRQLASPTTSPVVHKVIITKNPHSNQPQAVPVQINQVPLNTGQSTSFQTMSSGGISLLPAGAQTPTKTYTLTPQGILSPNKQIVTTLANTGTPIKLGAMTVSKVPISPASKTPTKITMIPVSIGKSPQRSLIPGTGGISVLSKNLSDNTTVRPVTVTQNSGVKQTLITMSPSKVIKQGTVIQQPTSHIQLQPGQTLTGKQIITVPQQGLKHVQIPMSSGLTVQGSRFQYVRLVSPATQTSGTTVRNSAPLTSIVPASVIASSVTAGNVQRPQMKITLPVSVSSHLIRSKAVSSAQPVQRIILPAAPNQIRTSGNQILTTASTLAQIRPGVPPATSLPTGATILTSGNSAGGVQSFALVPASYVTQLAQIPAKTQNQALQQAVPIQQSQTQPVQQRQEFIPVDSGESISANGRSLNGTPIEPTGARPRKPCNCTKSQCLKLYCDCFANGEFCHNCNCNNCANNLDHEEERSRAIKSCLDRNPMAFHPKIGKGKDGERDRKHNKGCNCKRSGCLKNYCECYEAKIMCSGSCKCVGCKNFEESPERKTLMHLADAAEVRVQQQTAAKTKLSSQISGIPSRPPVSSATGERLPYTFITSEVAEATCACLLAQAEEAERLKMPPVVQERMVIEEFGRCLLQIIESANKTKDTDT